MSLTLFFAQQYGPDSERVQIHLVIIMICLSQDVSESAQKYEIV